MVPSACVRLIMSLGITQESISANGRLILTFSIWISFFSKAPFCRTSFPCRMNPASYPDFYSRTEFLLAHTPVACVLSDHDESFWWSPFWWLIDIILSLVFLHFACLLFGRTRRIGYGSNVRSPDGLPREARWRISSGRATLSVKDHFPDYCDERWRQR